MGKFTHFPLHKIGIKYLNQRLYSREAVGVFYMDCRIHRLLLCGGVRPPLFNERPGYDTKQSDGEVPVMLEL